MWLCYICINHRSPSMLSGGMCHLERNELSVCILERFYYVTLASHRLSRNWLESVAIVKAWLGSLCQSLVVKLLNAELECLKKAIWPWMTVSWARQCERGHWGDPREDFKFREYRSAVGWKEETVVSLATTGKMSDTRGKDNHSRDSLNSQPDTGNRVCLGREDREWLEVKSLRGLDRVKMKKSFSKVPELYCCS